MRFTTHSFHIRAGNAFREFKYPILKKTPNKNQKICLPNIGSVFKACKLGGWMAQNHPRFPNRGTDWIRQAADREFLISEELEWQTGRREKDE